MSEMLHLRLPTNNEVFALYSTDVLELLPNLSRVNILIGQNNSGKSRFMRQIYQSIMSLPVSKENGPRDPYKRFIQDQKGVLDTFFVGDVTTICGIPKSFASSLLKRDSGIEPQVDWKQAVFELLHNMQYGDDRVVTKDGKTIENASSTPAYKNCVTTVRHNAEKFTSNLLSRMAFAKGELSRAYYIPILRGMRPPTTDEVVTFYETRTREDYFGNRQGDLTPQHKIWTGLELYKSIRAMLLGEPAGREVISTFQDFLGENFFDHQDVTLIPRENDDVIHVKIGTEEQFPIHQLGDGLQNLIILLFPIFTETHPTWFFMEEPDVNMHPGFQRAFMQILATANFSQHRFFFTTHSNHFLDMTMDYSDISVYLFKKNKDKTDKKFTALQVASSARQTLLELGVHSSSVFLSNSTIWVEGITDRLYFKEYMRKYTAELRDAGQTKEAEVLENLKEDIHYSFMEYGGANLPHFAFAENEAYPFSIRADYACSTAIVLADGDVCAKGSRASIYEKMLGDRFIILGCKEVENLIPVKIVSKLVKKELELKEKDASILKYNNYVQLKTKSLGEHLDGKIGTTTIKDRIANNKLGFCQKAIAHMNNPEIVWSLPKEISAICDKIFKHILTQSNMK